MKKWQNNLKKNNTLVKFTIGNHHTYYITSNIKIKCIFNKISTKEIYPECNFNRISTEVERNETSARNRKHSTVFFPLLIMYLEQKYVNTRFVINRIKSFA